MHAPAGDDITQLLDQVRQGQEGAMPIPRFPRPWWLRESLAVRQANFPKGHWLIASSESILGEHLVLEKRFAEAEQRLLASEQKLLADRGEEAPVIQDARKRIVKLYEAWSRPAQAEEWRARLKKKASDQ